LNPQHPALHIGPIFMVVHDEYTERSFRHWNHTYETREAEALALIGWHVDCCFKPDMEKRTLAEALALPPGPELDQEIAERLFGRPRPDVAYSSTREGFNRLWEFMTETGDLRPGGGNALYHGKKVPWPFDRAGQHSALCRLALLAGTK
jgi:hypothetical protein